MVPSHLLYRGSDVFIRRFLPPQTDDTMANFADLDSMLAELDSIVDGITTTSTTTSSGASSASAAAATADREAGKPGSGEMIERDAHYIMTAECIEA